MTEKDVKNFFSNTYAGTCNNSMLFYDREKTITARIFYRVSVGGEYNYRFFFSNNAFSTFYDGKVSRANLKGGNFRILSAKAGCCAGDYNGFDGKGLKVLTFRGSPVKDVLEGGEFWSDPVKLNISSKDYLVFEWTVSGSKFPYTPDKIIPGQVLQNGKYVPDNDFPQPCMVACDRPIEKKFVFLGDSITQGLETEFNAYKFWAALIGERLSPECGVWNLGLGHGRVQDAASDGVWLAAAKMGDFVNICYGINDILHGRSAKNIESDLSFIVEKLRDNGVKSGVFTVPPFDFPESAEKIRVEINSYITEQLSRRTEYVFDFAGALCNPSSPYKTIYGPHPNNEGCRVAAEKFLSEINIFNLLF